MLVQILAFESKRCCICPPFYNAISRLRCIELCWSPYSRGKVGGNSGSPLVVRDKPLNRGARHCRVERRAEQGDEVVQGAAMTCRQAQLYYLLMLSFLQIVLLGWVSDVPSWGRQQGCCADAEAGGDVVTWHRPQGRRQSRTSQSGPKTIEESLSRSGHGLPLAAPVSSHFHLLLPGLARPGRSGCKDHTGRPQA